MYIIFFHQALSVKKTIVLLLLLFCSALASAQKLESGIYSSGLKLAFDTTTNWLTGYFEDATGWDEVENIPRFSCAFYLEGLFDSKQITIKTYFLGDNALGTIPGILMVDSLNHISIKLEEEHGGCWNVQPFSAEALSFLVEKKTNWIQIRYINADKVFFFAEPKLNRQKKSYLIRNDIVFVEAVQNEWAYCKFLGDQERKGWIPLMNLNELK